MIFSLTNSGWPRDRSCVESLGLAGGVVSGFGLLWFMEIERNCI